MSKQIIINLSDKDFEELEKQYEEMKSSKTISKGLDMTSVNTFLESVIKTTICTNKYLSSDFFTKTKLTELLEKLKKLSDITGLKDLFDSFEKGSSSSKQESKKLDEEKYKS